MYEANALPANRYHDSLGKKDAAVRGHTVPLLQASVRRARAEGLRVCYWTDLHTDFPSWMWKDGLRNNPVRDDLYEEAALHIAYFVKYLAARHGIPIHAASFSSQPGLPGGHCFSPEQLLRGAKALREKLDEAGLPGVRAMPCTALSMNRVNLGSAKGEVDTLNELAALLEGKMREYAPCVDILAGHGLPCEPPLKSLPRNTRYWRVSGDFNEHWPNSAGFDLGPGSMLDEVIRHHTWLYGQGASSCGVLHVAGRMGLGGDFFRLPETFDRSNFGRREIIEGGAVVGPHVRPGMWLAEGSLGKSAREPFSVDAFSAPGQREVIVISNGRGKRNFRIMTEGTGTRFWRVFQTTPGTGCRDLGELESFQGRLYLQAPPHSVSAVVAVKPGRKPLLTAVVKDARAVPQDLQPVLTRVTRNYDVQVVSETLTQEEQNRLKTKRHPVDPFGSTVFLLDDSIERPDTIRAYRTVMAPVVAIGSTNAFLLGVNPGTRVEGGAPLLHRDELDPPAKMLESGLPKACGMRIGVQSRITWADLEFTLASLIPR